MTRATFLNCGLALLALVGLTGSASADVSGEIEKAAKAYDTAIAAGDAEALGALLDDDGHFVDEEGRLHDKKQHIGAYLDEKRTWESAESSERTLRVVSPAVVIETATFLGTGQLNGKPFRLHTRYTDVWVKKEGRWVVVAEQSTPIANSKTPPGAEEPVSSAPAGLPATITLKQRSTTEVPGTDGKLSITADDITRGQVMLTLVDTAGKPVFGPVSMSPNKSKLFQFVDATYSIKVKELDNALVGNDFVSVIISHAHAEQFTEDQKIESLIAAVETLEGSVFIRNGTEYTPSEAAAHLRKKLDAEREEIQSASQFVDVIASRSSLTGEAYKIRMASGEEVEARAYLRAELAKVDSSR